MEEISLTAKIKLDLNAEQKILLDQTISAYTTACNFVSEYAFSNEEKTYAKVNKALYRKLRSQFNLKAQMAQSVVKTVVARYKTILANQKKWIKASFKRPQYDLVWNRDYSLVENRFSLNTLEGRVKLPFFSKGMTKFFDKSVYRFGTAKLVKKQDKYYLYASVTRKIEECKIEDIKTIVGVDRGTFKSIATCDTNNKTLLVSGKAITLRRAYEASKRKEIQQRKTRSGKRKLIKNGNRENRWVQDRNHCIAKALVESYPEKTLFVLEDLTNIRKKLVKVRIKNRYFQVSWPYYDLEQKIMYKAKLHKCLVIKVDPRYTSQRCPKCGHTEPSNRHHSIHHFVCKNCGYQSNDDRIGAMNLLEKGKEYIKKCLEQKKPDTEIENL